MKALITLLVLLLCASCAGPLLHNSRTDQQLEEDFHNYWQHKQDSLNQASMQQVNFSQTSN